MIKSMVSETTSGQMDEDIWDFGKMVNNMAMPNI